MFSINMWLSPISRSQKALHLSLNKAREEDSQSIYTRQEEKAWKTRFYWRQRHDNGCEREIIVGSNKSLRRNIEFDDLCST